jgi:hypothetical protein
MPLEYHGFSHLTGQNHTGESIVMSHKMALAAMIAASV